MRRWTALAVVALSVGGLAAGCGGDGSGEAAGDAATFDQAFVDAMVPHHESALEMAREAKDAGLAEPELIEIADAILDTQQREIDQMRAWRGEWFGSTEVDPDGAAALGLTVEEMGMMHASGSFAGAEDVDAAFAAAMIAHHEGAVAMAELALERADHDELRDLAQAILDTQSAEIEMMRPHAAGLHSMHE